MTPAVVDTDVVSFLFKNDSRAQLYLPWLQNRELLVSFMTEAVLEQWIVLAKWGAGRVQRFHDFMNGFASVPSSRDLILRWADVMVAARGNGRRIEVRMHGSQQPHYSMAPTWSRTTPRIILVCRSNGSELRLNFVVRAGRNAVSQHFDPLQPFHKRVPTPSD
jgi:predicted nucleic acid-binding protein